MARGDDWRPWQRAYRFGTFVLWPPDELRARVNALRARYDPASQRICEAHVSVTQPLRAAPTEDEWRLLRETVAGHPAFDVAVGPVGSFLPATVVWLAVRPPEPILALRTALHATGLFDLARPHPEHFVPHMTISEGFSGPPVDQALVDHLAATVEGGAFRCTDIAHVVPDDDVHFVVERRLPLASRADTDDRRGSP